MIMIVEDVRGGVSRPEQDGEPIDGTLACYIAALGLSKWLNRVQSRPSGHLA